MCPEVPVNDQFLPGKSELFVKLPEKKIKILIGNLPGKIEFFYPDPRLPRFKTRLTPLCF